VVDFLQMCTIQSENVTVNSQPYSAECVCKLVRVSVATLSKTEEVISVLDQL